MERRPRGKLREPHAGQGLEGQGNRLEAADERGWAGLAAQSRGACPARPAGGQPVAAGTLLLPSGSPSDPSPPAPELRAHTKQHIRSGSSGHSRSSCPPRQEPARAAAAARVPPGTAVGAVSGAACRKWGPWFLLLFFSLSSEVLEGGRFHGNRRGRQGPEVITQNNEFSSRSLRAETVPVRGCTHPAPPPSRNPQISRKTWWCFKCIARKLIRKHSFFNRERHTIF